VVEETWEILRLLGIDERRLYLKWISASEGIIFAEEMRSFTARIKELGPSPLKTVAAEAAPSEQKASA